MSATTRVLRVGTLTPITTLDPREAHDFTGLLVMTQVFETPYRRVGKTFVPVLMDGPMRRRSDVDATVFEAGVRSGARFSDGSPVTADDIVASVRASLPDGSTVHAEGERVVIRVGRAAIHAEEALSLRTTSVVRVVGDVVLGTGPFVVAEVGPQEIRLARNPHASRQPVVDEIVVRCFVPNSAGRPEALLDAVESGEIDFTLALSRDDVAPLKNARKLFEPGMSTAFLALNTQTPHFRNRNLRHAIAKALDRYRLTELCYSNPAGFVARTLLPPGLGRGNDRLRPDPDGARTLVAEQPLPPRLRLVRVWGPRPYLPRPDAVASGIELQLRALGTTVETIAAADSEDYPRLLRDGDYDLVLGGWVADTTDPIDYLRSTLSSNMIPTRGRSAAAASNYARWHDDEVDRLLEQVSPASLDETIDRILTRVAEEVPLVPLMYGPRVIVHSRRIRGFDPGHGLMPDFAAFELDD